MPRAKKGERWGGRQKGTPNRRTVARVQIYLEEQQREAENLPALPPPTTPPKPLPKRMQEQIASVSQNSFDAYEQQQQLAKIALTQVQEQWKHHGTAEFNSGKLTEAIRLADKMLTGLLPYCKPRLSAMLVGGQVVTKIEVTGGMPDEWANPPNVVEFPAGTVIEAYEEIGSSSKEVE
jgi:hypothetical protein